MIDSNFQNFSQKAEIVLKNKKDLRTKNLVKHMIN